MTIERAFVTLENGNQVHYRTAGAGAPLVMLHPSPQCSETLIPAINTFSSHCECFALDTPGYGLSDDIKTEIPAVFDYIGPIMEAIDKLGIDRFCLYGSATGGQIGIELAKRFPERIVMLMLDTNGHMSEEQIDNTLKGYLPDVSPRRDGGHLLTYWDMCRHLYVTFPWNSSALSDRTNIDLPPVELVHSVFLRYLRAGTTYSKAYRAAFLTEHIDHIKNVKIPTTILRWQGSIILDVTDALIDFGLSDNFKILNAGPTLKERYDVQLDALKEMYTEPVAPAANAKEHSNKSALKQSFISSGDVNVHALQNNQSEGRPVILLHSLTGSAKDVWDLGKSMIGKRPVYAFDLPWHGETGPTQADLTMDALTDPILNLIREQQLESADIVGFGSGGAIALEIATRLQSNNLYLIDPEILTDDEITNYKSNGIPDIAPCIDGSHLVKVWAMIRDDEFYSPWFDHTKQAVKQCDANLAPQHLHQKAEDILKLIYTYPDIKRLSLDYDWGTATQKLNASFTVATSTGYPHSDNLSRLQNTKHAALPSLREDWLRSILK